MGELERFIPAIGMDISRPVLKQAKEAHRSFELVSSVSEMLPFRDRTFDAVVLLETLEHVADDRQTIREAIRVLDNGGSLVISVPNDRFLFRIMDLEYWLIPLLTGRQVHRHYRRREIKRMLEQRGLRVEHLSERGMLLAATIRWVMLPFDLMDFFVLGQVMGPLGRGVRKLVNPFVDREFSLETNRGASIFLRARKRPFVSTTAPAG